jgi:hypothetical protein
MVAVAAKCQLFIQLAIFGQDLLNVKPEFTTGTGLWRMRKKLTDLIQLLPTSDNMMMWLSSSW